MVAEEQFFVIKKLSSKYLDPALPTSKASEGIK